MGHERRGGTCAHTNQRLGIVATEPEDVDRLGNTKGKKVLLLGFAVPDFLDRVKESVQVGIRNGLVTTQPSNGMSFFFREVEKALLIKKKHSDGAADVITSHKRIKIQSFPKRRQKRIESVASLLVCNS